MVKRLVWCMASPENERLKKLFDVYGGAAKNAGELKKASPDEPENSRAPVAGLKSAALRPYRNLIGQWQDRVSRSPHVSVVNVDLAEFLAHASHQRTSNGRLAKNLLDGLMRLETKQEWEWHAGLYQGKTRDAEFVRSVMDFVRRCNWPVFSDSAVPHQDVVAHLEELQRFVEAYGLGSTRTPERKHSRKKGRW